MTTDDERALTLTLIDIRSKALHFALDTLTLSDIDRDVDVVLEVAERYAQFLQFGEAASGAKAGEVSVSEKAIAQGPRPPAPGSRRR